MSLGFGLRGRDKVIVALRVRDKVIVALRVRDRVATLRVRYKVRV